MTISEHLKMYADDFEQAASDDIFNIPAIKMFFGYARISDYCGEILNEIENISESELIDRIANRYHSERFSDHSLAGKSTSKLKAIEASVASLHSLIRDFVGISEEGAHSAATRYMHMYARAIVNDNMPWEFHRLSRAQFDKITDRKILEGVANLHY